LPSINHGCISSPSKDKTCAAPNPAPLPYKINPICLHHHQLKAARKSSYHNQTAAHGLITFALPISLTITVPIFKAVTKATGDINESSPCINLCTAAIQSNPCTPPLQTASNPCRRPLCPAA
jgi:hypothetical protein